MKRIEIRCKGAAEVDFEEIRDFQGGLKAMDPADEERLRKEILTRGFNSPIHVWKEKKILWNLDGHQRCYMLAKFRAEGYEVPPVPIDFIYAKSWEEAKRILLSRISQYGKVQPKGFQQYIETANIGLEEVKEYYSLPGFDIAAFEHEFYLRSSEKNPYDLPPEQQKKLADQFVVPPFSVLDARQGYWQQRKRAWIALGIQSELGRTTGKENAVYKSFGKNTTQDLTNRKNKTDRAEKILQVGDTASIFDPVLCELAYRWFCPKGGSVFDPFAGGSVRGIVASALGRKYTGIDLREEQIEANKGQWEELKNRIQSEQLDLPEDNIVDETPIEQHGKYWIKRDDLFVVAGVCGGKVRTCWHLAQGADGLVTAGSRSSPQVNIVAQIARKLQISCRIHTPLGTLSEEVQAAVAADAELVQHKAGYNNVIIARARADAKRLGFREIPFGMECEAAVEQTRGQVASLKPLAKQIKRIVIPVGSGMSLAGVLHGLRDSGIKIPVVGVKVGADPTKRLVKYAPKGWEKMVTLVKGKGDYHKPHPKPFLGDLQLDPYYEAKCLPHLKKGDLFWIVGIRQTAKKTRIIREAVPPTWICADSRHLTKHYDDKADFLFSCPPYGDLEVYSDNPADISNMGYGAFLGSYGEIIRRACDKLKNNRFACFVVGDFRDPKGVLRDFVSETIRAFDSAGLALYNEAVLVTAVGSASIRASYHFPRGRKLTKTHQNVLVFLKGDAKKALEACGEIGVELPETLKKKLEEEESGG